MDIAGISSKYRTALLEQKDIGQIVELCRGNPLYYHHCPPPVSAETVASDMAALPPGKTCDDKYYLGFFDGEKLAAVLDLIVRYPDDQTAFIGFFMLRAEYQGRGEGSALVGEICRFLKQEFSFIRLGFVKGNPQSEHFWRKNGFEPTGQVSNTDDYQIIIMRKEL